MDYSTSSAVINFGSPLTGWDSIDVVSSPEDTSLSSWPVSPEGTTSPYIFPLGLEYQGSPDIKQDFDTIFHDLSLYPTKRTKKRSSCRSTSSYCDSAVICLSPNCTSSFKRRADLDRHYRHLHCPSALKEVYICDYPRCPRHKDPFNRRDHFRDHLREFHNEKIEKRSHSSSSSSSAAAAAASISDPSDLDTDGEYKWSKEHGKGAWWRCGRCLTRVTLRTSGGRCGDCGNTFTSRSVIRRC